MGFSIGGLLKDVGINLPKIDLGNIGKDILTEGKKLLGDVVKDSFTLSNKPGETFADDMNLNLLGENVRLPNPIGRLANKLLGGLDNKLGDFGVNVDFKKILGKFFHLPTEAGDVQVPDVKQRLAQVTPPTAAGANATGGGAVTASNATPGANATGGADASSSTGSTGPTLNSGIDGMFNNLGNQESGLMGQLDQALNQTPDDKGMITINGKQVNASAYMQKLQFQMNIVQEMMQTLSNILKTQHDGRMNTIANIRG